MPAPSSAGRGWIFHLIEPAVQASSALEQQGERELLAAIPATRGACQWGELPGIAIVSALLLLLF